MADTKQDREQEKKEHRTEIAITETNAMYLRLAIGDGEIDGRKFALSSVVGTGGLVVDFDNGPSFLLSSRQFVEAAYEIVKRIESQPSNDQQAGDQQA